MKNKQTAVDFLIEHIKLDAMYEAKSIYEWKNVFEKAKAMEKEQIEKSYNKGIDHQLSRYISPNSEKYYNETYANDTTTGLPKEDSKRRGWHY